MRVFASFLLAVFCLSNTAWSQQLLVFPAVVDEVPGEGDSVWVTVVRVVKKNPQDSVTVRRKWVCLPGGGFVDEPTQAPSWDLTGSRHDDRMLYVEGRELLEGTDAQRGSVALEAEGGDVLAHAYVADVSRGLYYSGAVAFGLGQLIPAQRSPQIGRSHIPWLPGCTQIGCEPFGAYWEYMRDNIGILNPNPEPLEITGEVVVFSNQDVGELYYETEAFVREIRPYEWVQFRWVADQGFYGTDHWGIPYHPTGGFILNFVPNQDLPYYAYASVVFSPDPSQSDSDFSDPMFVPAEPGYVPSFYDSPPITRDIGKDHDYTQKTRE